MESNPFSYSAVYSSPVGDLGIHINHHKLTSIEWLKPEQQYFDAESAEAAKVTDALDQYFQLGVLADYPDFEFSGSQFQNRVWQALLKIPFGSTKTYGEMAKQLNTSSRAIGQACKRNRIPIFIPCHRVVAKDHIGGFFGKSEPSHIKQWLLNHEAKH